MEMAHTKTSASLQILGTQTKQIYLNNERLILINNVQQQKVGNRGC